jgi:hypothetical protein
MSLCLDGAGRPEGLAIGRGKLESDHENEIHLVWVRGVVTIEFSKR